LPDGDCVVIGIGLNVNREQFPVELTGNATSLALMAGAPLDRTRALAELLAHVEQRVDAFVRGGAAAIVRALTPRLALLDTAARLDEQQGVVRGVADSGALLFETARGVETVVAGRLTAL
jgi:BirA family biotin operon repressor/biotin-[acetyl-CoA-carboxylase] ligase